MRFYRHGFVPISTSCACFPRLCCRFFAILARGEGVSAGNIEAHVWTRAAAAAERFWSPREARGTGGSGTLREALLPLKHITPLEQPLLGGLSTVRHGQKGMQNCRKQCSV